MKGGSHKELYFHESSDPPARGVNALSEPKQIQNYSNCTIEVLLTDTARKLSLSERPTVGSLS